MPEQNKRPHTVDANQEERLKAHAQEEAGMMRDLLHVSPETGRIDDAPGRRYEKLPMPTAEDYDAALAAIEELKALEAEQPGTEKVLNILGRLAARGSYGVTLLLDAVTVGGSHNTEHHQKTYVEPRETLLSARMQGYEDASMKLKELKGKARDYDAA